MFKKMCVYLCAALFWGIAFNATAAQEKTITIKGELSCGSAMCNIGDDYDIPFPIKGIELFNYCKDGDECEIKAQVNGKTVVKIISAKKIQ